MTTLIRNLCWPIFMSFVKKYFFRRADLKSSISQAYSYIIKSPLALGLLIVIILSWVLAGITENVLDQESIVHIDRWALAHTHLIHGPTLTHAMILITNLGSGYMLWSVTVFSIVYLIRLRRTFDAKFVGAMMVGGGIIEIILKTSVQRARPVPPSGMALAHAWGWGYPSGHTLLSTLFYFTLAYFVSSRSESKSAEFLAYFLAFCFVLLIAFSRVYLEVHYVSDTLAGLIAGLLWFTVCLMITEYYKKKLWNG